MENKETEFEKMLRELEKMPVPKRIRFVTVAAAVSVENMSRLRI